MTKESFDFEQRAEGQEIFLFSSVWTNCGAHPSSLSVGASASFSEGKVAECEADHSSPSNTEVKKECSCTSTPSVCLQGMYVDNLPVPYQKCGLS